MMENFTFTSYYIVMFSYRRVHMGACVHIYLCMIVCAYENACVPTCIGRVHPV